MIFVQNIKLCELEMGVVVRKSNNNNNNNNNNKDVIIRDNEKGTCMLIDVVISGDRNVIKKRS